MPGPGPLTDDLRELIELLQSHQVEFLVVGAHALAFHARCPVLILPRGSAGALARAFGAASVVQHGGMR